MPAAGVAYGTLVSKLELAGLSTVNPVQDHSVYFIGETPSDRFGRPLGRVIAATQQFELESGLIAQHSFSSRPADGSKYPDYFVKMTTYTEMLAGQARALDPEATAQTYRILPETDADSPFVYPDTGVISDKLRGHRLAIVGLGGTGSYVLDLVAKSPVAEIHIYDADDFVSHNAFRAPGAASLEDLNTRPKKVDYHAARYSNIKRGIHPHAYAIDAATIEELRALDFVFLCLEGGPAKRLLVDRLDEFDIPFVEVGIGLVKSDDSLTGTVRICTSTPGNRRHIFDRKRIDFGEPQPDDIYDDNIQTVEMNALNATLAVIKWKKLCGFYLDIEQEYFAAYQIDGNHIVNDDCP